MKGRRMYRIGICEDEEKIAEWLERVIAKRYEADIRRYESQELMKTAEEEPCGYPDILILDIKLGEQNGIELAKRIQEVNRQVQIIFITGYTEYVSDVFETRPIYLLLKPIQEEKLYAALEKAIAELMRTGEQTLHLTIGDKILRIPYRKIEYVESDGRYLYIHQNSQTDRVTMKLSELMKLLPECFLRCHQSYVVNMERILKFSGKEIELQNGVAMPVSRSRYPKVRDTILHYFANRMQKEMENL